MKIGVEDLMLVEPTTLNDHDLFFTKAYTEVCNRLKLVRFANSRQIEKISYMTVYKDIMEINKKTNIEIDPHSNDDDFDNEL